MKVRLRSGSGITKSIASGVGMKGQPSREQFLSGNLLPVHSLSRVSSFMGKIISYQGASAMRNLAAKCVIGAACGTTLLVSAARASVIAYEPFNYSAGSISGDSGGGSTGWTGG